MGDLLDPLTDLGSRLDVGLSYREYATKVGDVKVAYDRTNFDEIADPACLKRVAVPLERPFVSTPRPGRPGPDASKTFTARTTVSPRSCKSSGSRPTAQSRAPAPDCVRSC